MKLVIALCVVMVPGMVSAQHRGADTGSGGAAVPSGASIGGGSSSSGSSSSSGGSGSTSQNGSGSFSSAGHRTGSVTFPTNPAAANTTSGAFTNYSNLTGPAPEFARPRSSLPINAAFPKGSVPTITPANGNLTFIIGAYNPWLYAYNGLYDMPFYGVFDPFALDFGYAGSQVSTTTTTTPSKDEKGVLHLNVKPHNAEVYVDGGLAGKADQFEGVFHKLRLDEGIHRIELRAPGYEALIVNVRIQAGESMTYRGALEKIVP